MALSTSWLCLIALGTFWVREAIALPWESLQQVIIAGTNPGERDQGHNELYIPEYDNPIPGKVPFEINKKANYYEKYINGSEGGYVRRSSCPAVNALANRGYIPRSGRNVSYAAIAQAARDVYNFGDDNIIIVLSGTFASHPGLTHINLDMMADDAAQHHVNCPASPTRNDRELGDNVNLNMTLLESLLSFSKDGETLSMEDLAEHHHLRHNQSLAENPNFRFGNLDAACALAQYANLVGVLGNVGKHGLLTLSVEDTRKFYAEEDLPTGYARRQLPFYTIETQEYIDRMSHHIGFQIVRPWPKDDQDGRDVEPVVAKFDV